MKGCSFKGSSNPENKIQGSNTSEPESRDKKLSKSSLWSGFLVSAYSVFDKQAESKGSRTKDTSKRVHGWTATVKRVMNISSMRRIQERVLGLSKTELSISTSDIWLLGSCYKMHQEDVVSTTSEGLLHSDGFVAFVEDFSSRIIMTYRKGFMAIGDSKYSSDVNWGCMLRSSQMLVAQALICHQLGRSWRKHTHKPPNQDYIDILQLFGDSEAAPFSIHNLLEAGKTYALAPGSWVGPYAMCRTWETLIRPKIKKVEELTVPILQMAIYVVSGDEDGERGGAPVVCIEDATRCCFEFSEGGADWTPILLLVPLVLGLDKINSRYIPLLVETFKFPQSLGILGGRPGVSTYIVGVQDDKAFYLDPHEVQQVVELKRDNLEADTSSYHCNIVRQMPLDTVDPSLAIGFYCRDRDDFDNFCKRASELAEKSNGAPLFTVTKSRSLPRAESGVMEEEDYVDEMGTSEDKHEDDWQLL